MRGFVSYKKSTIIGANIAQRMFLGDKMGLMKFHGIKVGLNNGIRYGYSSGHIYKDKTTKQIEKQIAMQKWRDLQNTFKSLGSGFGLRVPTQEQLGRKDYMKPDKIEYNLQNLRECSRSYGVYLYYELARDGSGFNGVIQKVIDNLWRAEKKEAMQFLQFLEVWGYRGVDVGQLYGRVVDRYDMDMGQIFEVLKKFQGRLGDIVELKVLKRLNEGGVLSSEYGSLLRIVNYFTVKGRLSQGFYEAVAGKIRENINRIAPTEVLEAYIYFTFNVDEYGDVKGGDKQLRQQGEFQNVKGGDDKGDGGPGQQLGVKLLRIIQGRILSQQCIRFLNGDQIIGLLHTFIKNNKLMDDISDGRYYSMSIDRIMNRIEIIYVSQDFSVLNKQKLLEICYVLPEVKRQTVVALLQREVLKKREKFDYNLVGSVFLVSYENNMMTEEIRLIFEKLILENIYHLQKDKIAKILWLFTLGGVKDMNRFHQKVQDVLNGGFVGLSIKDVCVIVWSMCVGGYKENGVFWGNVQAFLVEELNRGLKQGEDKVEIGGLREKRHRKLVNECCWILWAYHNNRYLKLKTLDLIVSIIVDEFPVELGGYMRDLGRLGSEEIEHGLTSFELISMISFFYSIEYPSKGIVCVLEEICLQGFVRLHMQMDSIQLCKCLKYIGGKIWGIDRVKDSILDIFEIELEKVLYRDIMSIVGILLASGVKSQRVVRIIKRLMERKKNLEALGVYEDRGFEKNDKKDKNLWGFKLPF